MSGILDPERRSEIVEAVFARAKQKQYEDNEKPKEDIKEIFLSKISDIFTTKDYNLLIDEIYRGKEGYLNIKGSYPDITAKEFKAIVSNYFYNFLLENVESDEKIKSKSEIGETSSFLRMLNLALNEQKRTFDILSPVDYTSDMGGLLSERGLDLCACLAYTNQGNDKDIDFVCILHNATLPYHIEDVIGVFKTEEDPDGKNDIHTVCPHTKNLDAEICKKLRPKLCDLHNKAIRLKQGEECFEKLPDYIERKYKSVVDQIIDVYEESVYFLEDVRSYESKFKDIDEKAKKIAKKIFQKHYNKSGPTIYQ